MKTLLKRVTRASSLRQRLLRVDVLIIDEPAVMLDAMAATRR